MEANMTTHEPTASSPKDTTSDAVGDLSAQFARQQRPKSPPLAFEPTPNDALAPRIPSADNSNSNITSPQRDSSSMGRLSSMSLPGDSPDLQSIVNQQAMALKLAHQAFAAERAAWDLEKDKLYARITSLEQLLRMGDGYSPAKSPIHSPYSTSNVTSPQARAQANSQRLPSIAEDEKIPPLSSRREGAPTSIDISNTSNFDQLRRRSSVGFHEATSSSVKVEEIPAAPRGSMAQLSPPPMNYRMEAGHTPLKRPPTPPPQNSMSMDGIEDTPTRNNTHINTYLTRSNDEDSEKELKGPLNMPELPHVPGEHNFTFDMLSKRLQSIEQHPDDVEARPMVYAQPSPGLASPVEKELSPKTKEADAPPIQSERPIAPPATRAFGPADGRTSDIPSNTLSPNGMASLSKQTSRDQDDAIHAHFDNGGIKLKKKASTNFGAPFGQLGEFGGGRKLS